MCLARRDLTDRWYLEQVRAPLLSRPPSVRVPLLISPSRVREQEPTLYTETHCESTNRERNGYLYALPATGTRNLLAINSEQEPRRFQATTITALRAPGSRPDHSYRPRGDLVDAPGAGPTHCQSLTS